MRLPDDCMDAVITETETTVSFGDRLRILLGGHIHTRVVTGTEHLPGKTRNLETRGRVDWPAWWPIRRKLPAYQAEDRP